jgi:signal transduction histidine kinase
MLTRVVRSSSAPVRVQPWQRAISLRWTLLIFTAAIALFPNLAIAFILGGGLPLLWIVALVGLSTAFGWWLSLVLLQPINALRSELSSLERTRDRAMRLEVDATQPSEVQNLRAAFSTLLGSLSEEQEKRSAFMATLVHDLKTPIIAATHVLEAIERDDALTRDRRIELISQVKTEFEGLLRLVQQMVDAHRFERDDFALHLEPTDLADLARRVVARLETSARHDGVTVTVSGEGSAAVSKPELERALGNLVTNALRYAGSQVDIEVSSHSLTVADDGPGLPAPLSELVRPFNSQLVTMGGQRFTAGTGGLGLFIASRVAEAHGGALEQLPTSGGTSLRLRLEGAR